MVCDFYLDFLKKTIEQYLQNYIPWQTTNQGQGLNKNIFRHQSSQEIHHSCSLFQKTTGNRLPQNKGMYQERMNQENARVNSYDYGKMNFRRQLSSGSRGKTPDTKRIKVSRRDGFKKKEIGTKKNYLLELTFWEIIWKDKWKGQELKKYKQN